MCFASIGLLSVILASSVSGQSRPDFSGTWKNDRTATRIGGSGNSPVDSSLNLGPAPHTLVISQDVKRLVVDEHYGIGQHRVTYPIDDQKVNTHILISQGRSAGTVVSSEWNKDQLVCTLEVSFPGETTARRYTHTIALNNDGSLMVRTEAVGSANSRTLVYRKGSP